MPTSSTFLLAGLFVLLGLTGWMFKWFIDRDRDLERPARINADYLRGLNLVLNRRTDEALELFLQMAKVDEETLETHFALGHLFRRRGEVDRAIRVHQNLLARPNLNDAQRHQALFSLAEDYLGAGLYDRAEKLFTELADSDTVAQAALERLVYIYERESEWRKAIESQRRLEMLTGAKSAQVAHYYCELAEQARENGDLGLAVEHLKPTVRSETGALRAALIRASIAMEEGEHAKAIGLYQHVLSNNLDFISEVLPSLFECHKESGRLDEFEKYIDKLVAEDPGAANDIAYAAIIGDLNASAVLARCVESFVFNDTVLGSLVDTEALRREGAEKRRDSLQRISSGLRTLALSSARYRCENCGYSTRRYIWHCPSCNQWETVRHIQRFQFDTVIS